MNKKLKYRYALTKNNYIYESFHFYLNDTKDKELFGELYLDKEKSKTFNISKKNIIKESNNLIDLVTVGDIVIDKNLQSILVLKMINMDLPDIAQFVGFGGRALYTHQVTKIYKLQSNDDYIGYLIEKD